MSSISLSRLEEGSCPPLSVWDETASHGFAYTGRAAVLLGVGERSVSSIDRTLPTIWKLPP